MDLYFSPLACSMATRVALYQAGADANFIEVDPKTKRIVADGSNYLDINPLGQVPVARTDDGDLLFENQAILQYVADRHPDAGLAAPAGRERSRIQQWLSFISTELHKLVFTPLLDAKSPDGAKSYARGKVAPRFAHLQRQLDGRHFLLDRFTVADAYLGTVLNWCRPSGIDFSEWPAVREYYRRMHELPSYARAFGEERVLFAEEQKRHSAA